jgi:hypothetical protein
MRSIFLSTCLARPPHPTANPGQWLARRIRRAERQPRIRQAGWPATELRWVTEHKGIEGNEVADQWATEGAGASGAEGKRRASLRQPTSAGRGITKTKWNERLAWVKARCHGKRYYLLARAPKDRPGAKEHCHPVPPVSDQ